MFFKILHSLWQMVGGGKRGDGCFRWNWPHGCLWVWLQITPLKEKVVSPRLARVAINIWGCLARRRRWRWFFKRGGIQNGSRIFLRVDRKKGLRIQGGLEGRSDEHHQILGIGRDDPVNLYNPWNRWNGWKIRRKFFVSRIFFERKRSFRVVND